MISDRGYIVMLWILAAALAVLVAGCEAVVPHPGASIIPEPRQYTCIEEMTARNELQGNPMLQKFMTDYERERHMLYAALGKEPPSCVR